jgi:hypothetical protein
MYQLLLVMRLPWLRLLLLEQMLMQRVGPMALRCMPLLRLAKLMLLRRCCRRVLILMRLLRAVARHRCMLRLQKGIWQWQRWAVAQQGFLCSLIWSGFSVACICACAASGSGATPLHVAIAEGHLAVAEVGALGLAARLTVWSYMVWF